MCPSVYSSDVFCQFRDCSWIYWYFNYYYSQPYSQHPAPLARLGGTSDPTCPGSATTIKCSFWLCIIILFINKDSGVRFGGEKLLVQKGLVATSWPTFLTRDQSRESLSSNRKPKWMWNSKFLRIPFYVCLSLSVFLTSPYSLWLVPVNWLLALPSDSMLVLLTQSQVTHCDQISHNTH